MNYIEYVSEKIADEMEARYVSVAPDGFPEASVLVFLRTGATTASLTSIYPDKETFERATEERKKRMSSNADKIKSVRTEEGEAALAFIR
jgi:hypothetical protein